MCKKSHWNFTPLLSRSQKSFRAPLFTAHLVLSPERLITVFRLEFIFHCAVFERTKSLLCCSEIRKKTRKPGTTTRMGGSYTRLSPEPQLYVLRISETEMLSSKYGQNALKLANFSVIFRTFWTAVSQTLIYRYVGLYDTTPFPQQSCAQALYS